MSDYYIDFPPLDDLLRLKRDLERDIGEIEYDLTRNERKHADLLLELENAKTALISVQAYIDEAKKSTE